MPDTSPEEQRGKSIATLTTMVGALVLARAVGNDNLSREILSAARDDVAARSQEAGAGRTS